MGMGYQLQGKKRKNKNKRTRKREKGIGTKGIEKIYIVELWNGQWVRRTI